MEQSEVRIGDGERERVRESLTRHTGEGRLTLDELSERLGEVYAAKTAADLDHALRELPPLQREQPARPRARRVPGGTAIGRFALLAVAMVAVWAVFAVTTGATYFWPVWPIMAIGFKAARFQGARWGTWGTWGTCGQRDRGVQRA